VLPSVTATGGGGSGEGWADGGDRAEVWTLLARDHGSTAVRHRATRQGRGNGELIPRGFRGRQEGSCGGAMPTPLAARRSPVGARFLHVGLNPRPIGVNARTDNR